MSRKPKVLFLDDAIHATAFTMLEPHCETIGRTASWASEDEVLSLCAEADAFLVRACKITARIMDAAPNLKIIARHGSGVDSVDVEAATERGIPVSITADANSPSVAEITLGMMMALARDIPRMDASMKAGEWNRNAFIGIELAGKTLGIVGLGNIGARVATLATAFGMRILAFDPPLPAEIARERGAEPVGLDTLLAESDIISFHTRVTPATRHTLDAEAVAKLKPGVRIVNTARGAIIDTDALVTGLKSGKIGAAALDSFETEPLPADHELRRLPNVILFPHVGGQTEEARVRMSTTAAQSILNELSGGRPQFVVNPDAYERRAALRKS